MIISELAKSADTCSGQPPESEANIVILIESTKFHLLCKLGITAYTNV